MTQEERAARIAQLREKLKTRRGKQGFAENVAQIEATIARLEAGEDE